MKTHIKKPQTINEGLRLYYYKKISHLAHCNLVQEVPIRYVLKIFHWKFRVKGVAIKKCNKKSTHKGSSMAFFRRKVT